MKDELKILRQEKEESQRAKLTLEKNVEQLKKDKDKEIKITKEKYEKQIKELKAVYQAKIKIMKETHEREDMIYENRLKSKDIFVEYVINVLADNDELMDYWQETVKEQAYEINESKKKLAEFRNVEEIASESQMTMKKQKEAIELLEHIIINKWNLTDSYTKLAENDLTKTNCEVSAWVNGLTSALDTQNTQLKYQSEYFEKKDELIEHFAKIEKMLSPTHLKDQIY